jgi:hypothetical protein
MTLDINQRIQLILEIEGEVGRYSKYDLSGSGLFENFSETVKDRNLEILPYSPD